MNIFQFRASELGVFWSQKKNKKKAFRRGFFKNHQEKNNGIRRLSFLLRIFFESYGHTFRHGVDSYATFVDDSSVCEQTLKDAIEDALYGASLADFSQSDFKNTTLISEICPQTCNACPTPTLSASSCSTPRVVLQTTPDLYTCLTLVLDKFVTIN